MIAAFLQVQLVNHLYDVASLCNPTLVAQKRGEKIADPRKQECRARPATAPVHRPVHLLDLAREVVTDSVSVSEFGPGKRFEVSCRLSSKLLRAEVICGVASEPGKPQ